MPKEPWDDEEAGICDERPSALYETAALLEDMAGRIARVRNDLDLYAADLFGSKSEVERKALKPADGRLGTEAPLPRPPKIKAVTSMVENLKREVNFLEETFGFLLEGGA